VSLSLAERVALKTPEEIAAWISQVELDLGTAALEQLAAKPWWFVGRPEQFEPIGSWLVWLILTGRGFGKTRAAAEWLIDQVIKIPVDRDGAPTEWGIIARKFDETRTACVEGPAGILRVLERLGYTEVTNDPGEKEYLYNKSKWYLLFGTGQKIHMLGADNKDAGRSFTFSGLWADEIAKWPYPWETWHEGLFPALRAVLPKPHRPRAVVTTTPKPIKMIIEWNKRTDRGIHITRGSIFDNARNLDPAALEEMRITYAGTALEQQELYGQVLELVEGALWNRTMVEPYRVKKLPTMRKIVVGVDPAFTSGPDSDLTGIIVVGLGEDWRVYVMEDLSGRYTPLQWANIAVNAYHRWKADWLVAEKTGAYDLVLENIRNVDTTLHLEGVDAMRGKQLRAGPVVGLYEQGRVSHFGELNELELQMFQWVPDVTPKSPDRVDALVHAVVKLNVNRGSGAEKYFALLAPDCPACHNPNPNNATVCAYCGGALEPSLEALDAEQPI
jgi:phage terminase large subunit-like protein